MLLLLMTDLMQQEETIVQEILIKAAGEAVSAAQPVLLKFQADTCS